jgi:ribosomal protein S18 acetylase RimI-like enzyme
MIIETASASDIPAIVALVNSAYRGAEAARGWTHEAGLLDGQRTNRAMIEEALLAEQCTILLLRDAPGAAPAGCVSIEPAAKERTWYLGMLTVDPRRQAHGLGRVLLQAGEDAARERGAQAMRMTVVQLRDSLIAWYERRGYRRTGETAPFPYADERFGRPLRPDLHFVVLERNL